jgi:hypothetical protein
MLIRRIGLFIFILGLLILMVSIASGKLNSQSLTLFCIGVPTALLGGTIWFRNRERTPVQRFRLLRKSQNKDEDQEV